MINPKSVAFAGYYGMQNFGDDLFAYACVEGANKYWPFARPSVIGPQLDFRAPSAVPKFLSAGIYGAKNHIGGLLRAAVASKEVIRNQMIVFGGGSLFGSENSGVFHIYNQGAKLRGSRLAAVGVSIGPFSSITTEKKMMRFLSRLDYISVRDRISYNAALSMGLRNPVLAADLAGVISEKWYCRNRSLQLNGRKILGIALCDFQGAARSGINNRLIGEVVRISRSIGCEVKIFSLNNHRNDGDDALALALERRLNESQIRCHIIYNVRTGVESSLQEIAGCDWLLSVRLHGAITAYLSKVPFILVEYHRKCSDFLNDIGQPAELRLDAGSQSYEIFSALRQLCEGNKEPEMLISEYRSSAERNFTAAPWAVLE